MIALDSAFSLYLSSNDFSTDESLYKLSSFESPPIAFGVLDLKPNFSAPAGDFSFNFYSK